MTSLTAIVPWAVFATLVICALAFDLGLFHRKARILGMREAGIWVGVWIVLAAGFAGYVFYRQGARPALDFTQAYFLELALSADNLFVFILIFSHFRVSASYQHRVLFWGIIGAVLTRGVFIVAGAAAVHRFHWILYALGAFLVYAAIKILLNRQEDIDPSRSLVLRLFRRLFRVADDETGPCFTVRRDGKLWATPLLAVLVVVEAVDVTFAVDSIPAVFGVTTDVFIVLTSNVFAVLGLRAMFFLISGLARRLPYLNYGIAVVLGFIGVKIMIQSFLTIPVGLSLGIVLGTLLVTTVASLISAQRLSK
jgi:tellurite resistance protein TerC